MVPKSKVGKLLRREIRDEEKRKQKESKEDTEMGSMGLRALLPGDLDRVSEIESRITGHSRKGFLEKRFAAAAKSPDGFIACTAVRDGKLAGYAIARIQEGEFGARGA